MENELLGTDGKIPRLADDAPGQERVEVHGEVVDRGAAEFGDVLGARAGLPIEESRRVADLNRALRCRFPGYSGWRRRTR